MSETYWVHVPSVGEYNTARPLLELIKKRGNRLVVSFFSPRAREFLGRQNLPDEVYKLPFPFGGNIERFVKRVKPGTFILVESDRFPALLGAKVGRKFVVNARMSERSFKFLKLLRFFYKPLFNSFNLIGCKDRENCNRFANLGVEKKRLKVCGNLKVVFTPPKGKIEITLPPKAFVIVAGSTHKGEEEVWFRAFKEIKKKILNAVLIVAPRHIERGKEVFLLSKSFGFKTALRSKTKNLKGEVLVVDTLGELVAFYQLSHISFVGGSLVPIGGHNLLEPAYFSKPTLYGPFVDKFRDLEEILNSLGLGFKVEKERDIYETVLKLHKEGVKPKGDLKEISQKVLNCYKNLLGL